MQGGGWVRARGGTPLKEGEGDSRAFQGFLIGDFSASGVMVPHRILYRTKNPQELHVAQELVPL